MRMETRHMIASYKNGNYTVMLLSDGTKIRSNEIEPKPGQNPDECFIADFPESMDVTITHRCSQGCPMCYAGCTERGFNGDILNAKWIDSLHPYTEMAIGGGNVFEHPDFIPFLEKIHEKKILANITVNQAHFLEYFDQIADLVSRKLVNAVGVSVFEPTKKLLDSMNSIPNTVAHCILGVTKLATLKKMYDSGIRLLLLGYKMTNRGSSFMDEHHDMIEANIEIVDKALPQLVRHFKVVSFDNMALEQLDVRRLMSEEEWKLFYMGDDHVSGLMTSETMFIDMVDNTFSYNSMEKIAFMCDENDTVDTMYQFLRDYRR